MHVLIVLAALVVVALTPFISAPGNWERDVLSDATSQLADSDDTADAPDEASEHD